MLENISSAEAWALLQEIEEYLFQETQFRLIKERVEGRVTTEKVVKLLKDLSELELLLPSYHENKDTEIARMEDVGEGIRKVAKILLSSW